MLSPIIGVVQPDQEIHARIGQVAAEWSWIETLLGEMLAHFCSADPGAMYVVSQNVASATVVGWLRTLADIQVKDPHSANVISDLLTEIDEARAERNVVIHGLWRAGDEPGFAHVQTLRWERSDVVREEVWSTADFEDLIANLHRLQTVLSNLGIHMGFFHLENRKSS